MFQRCSCRRACVFLQLNYGHNYALVASALKQTQSNNGNNIYLSEWMANCGGVLSLVGVTGDPFLDITLIEDTLRDLEYLMQIDTVLFYVDLFLIS